MTVWFSGGRGERERGGRAEWGEFGVERGIDCTVRGTRGSIFKGSKCGG